MAKTTKNPAAPRQRGPGRWDDLRKLALKLKPRGRLNQFTIQLAGASESQLRGICYRLVASGHVAAPPGKTLGVRRVEDGLYEIAWAPARPGRGRRGDA